MSPEHSYGVCLTTHLPSLSLTPTHHFSTSPCLPYFKNFCFRGPIFSPLSTKPAEKRRNVVAMAVDDQSSDPSQVVQEFSKSVQDTWNKTDNKLAVGGLGVAALIVLGASTGLIGTIDKEELVKKIEDALTKITRSRVDI